MRDICSGCAKSFEKKNEEIDIIIEAHAIDASEIQIQSQRTRAE